MRAILTCVDFADILQITLPYNFHHFSEVWVVTSPTDHATMKVANDFGAGVFMTNAFYENGAKFNKFKALEQGLDAMERHGILCIMDADVLWPKEVQLSVKPGNLYTPRRRMSEDVTKPIPPESEWVKCPLHPQQQEHAGYSQIFNADDPVLGPPPWHAIDFTSAGTADSFFQDKWPKNKKIRPPFEVLHLGPCGTNWCGRVTPYLDGTAPSEAENRAEALRDMRDKRRGKHGMDRFEHERL